MRIAVNASIYDSRASGLGVYTLQLTRALREQHAELVVFTSEPDSFPCARAIGGSGRPSRGLAGHLSRLLWTQTGLRRLCRAVQARVLLNTVPEGPLSPPVPQVTVVHDILPLFFPREFPRHQWYVRVLVPAVLRHSARVVAISEQTARDLVTHYRFPHQRITVVPPGVDCIRFSPRRRFERLRPEHGWTRYVLFVGNLAPHKNLHRLLRAFARVRGDVALVLAGDRHPRHRQSLESLVDQLGIRDRVHFLGFVPDDDLPRLYAGAACVVIPSLYEGFGLPVLEAMACGAPVVASNAGALPEAAGDAAVLIDPYDEAGLAAAMQRVLDDTAFAGSLIERGLARARQFTWEKTARGVLEAIYSVCGA